MLMLTPSPSPTGGCTCPAPCCGPPSAASLPACALLKQGEIRKNISLALQKYLHQKFLLWEFSTEMKIVHKNECKIKIQFLILRKVFLKIIVIAIIDKRKPFFQFYLLMSCPHTPVSKWKLLITCSLGLYSMVSSSYAHECKNNGVATTKIYCLKKGKMWWKKLRNRKSLTLCL